MPRPLPSSVQNVFTTDAVAMLVGVGEYKMRGLLRQLKDGLPPARYVPAYLVGNHAGRNKQRVFTAEDVVLIRAAWDAEKGRRKAAWQARMVRRRLRWAGKGVDPRRWRNRAPVLGPPAPPRPGGDAA